MVTFKAMAIVLSIIFLKGEACFPFATQPFYGPPAAPSTYYYVQPQQVPYSSRTRLASSNRLYSEQKDDLPVSTAGNDCLQKFENHKLICAEPIERRTDTSEDECQQLCDSVTCKSFQFDAATSSCDVFQVDHLNGIPRYPFKDQQNFRKKRDPADRSRPVGHIKRIFKRMTNEIDEVMRDSLRPLPNGQSITAYCDPSLVSSPGFTFTLVDEDCKLSIKEGLIRNQNPRDEFDGAIESFSSDGAPSRGPSHRSSGAGPVQLVIPETPDCLDGNKARIQLVEGIHLLQAIAVTTVQLDTPEICLQICRMNAHLDGTRFPKACKSAVFDRSSGKCSIYEEVISPNGDLNYTPDPNSIYFEKFCISAAELPILCDDVMHRIPQHTLDKRAIGTGAVVTTATQIDCIRQCITAKRRHNFECWAISYFFDWPSENCYLSRFTRIQRPDVYVPERKELVDYLEMPRCVNTIWQRDDASDWSEWSDCDRSMTRTRWRNCSTCSTSRERMPCIPKSTLNDEFPQELLGAELEPRIVAQTFEEARRLKQTSLRRSGEHERSLFGDNDYSHQDEVSYFGPPLKGEATSAFVQSEEIVQPQSNIFNIQSHIQKLRPEEEKRHSGRTSDLPAKESMELDPNEPAPFAPLKPDDLDFLNGLDSGELKLLKEAQSEAEREANREVRGFKNDIGDITTQDLHRKQLNIRRIDNKNRHEQPEHVHEQAKKFNKDSESVKVQVELDENGCNPRLKCCPVPSKATLKGCIIGYQMSDSGSKTTCLTDNCNQSRNGCSCWLPSLFTCVILLYWINLIV